MSTEGAGVPPMNRSLVVIAAAVCAAAIGALVSREVPFAMAGAALLAGTAVIVIAADPVRAILIVAAVRAMLEGSHGRTFATISGVGLGPADLLTLAILGGVGIWLVARVREGAAIRTIPTFAPAAVLLAFATMSLWYSPTPALGGRDLLKFAAAYAVYLLIVVAKPDLRMIRTFLWAIALGAIVPITLGLWQLSRGIGRPGALHGGLRIESTFDHPNTYGFYLVAVVAAVWGLRWLVSGRQRWIADAIGVAGFVSVGLTLSRNAWAATAILLLAVGWRYRAVLGAAVVGAAVMLALTPRLWTRATDFLEPGGGGIGNSLVGRLALWDRDLELWRSHPVLGRGWGSTLGSVDVAAHNDFLRALVEGGIVGVAAFTVLIVSLVLLGVRIGRSRGDLPRAFMGLAIGYALVSVTSNNLGKGAFQFTFWLLAGLAVVCARTSADQAARTSAEGLSEPVAPPEPELLAPPGPEPLMRAPLARSEPRVLLLVSTLDGSGPGQVMASLALSLPAFGIDPVLASTHGPTDSPLIRASVEAGLRVEHLRMRSRVDRRGPQAFRALLRELSPDVVHTRTIRADLVGRSAAAFGIPVINNIVNLYPQDCLVRLGPVLGRVTMAAARRTASRAELFVANARAVAENTSVAFGVDPERVKVIHDGIDPGRWGSAEPADLSEFGIAFGAPLAVCVARLHPQKGLEDLIDAVAMVTGSTGLCLAIAGHGPSRGALQERIHAAGIDHRAVLLGERGDVPEVLAGASLFVLPSRFEGLPTAIIEAMMAGLPVLATDVGGNAELVVDGGTGWLVPPGDPTALAAALVRGLHVDLDQIGAAGRRRAEERFSASVMASAFAELYRSVHAGRAPARALVRGGGSA